MSDGSTQQRHRDQVAFAAAALCAIAGVLIWMLWVLPIARSVGEAAPTPVGDSMTVELAAGESAGLWGSGQSVVFGTVDCSVVSPDGDPVTQLGPPALTWDDTVWWMNPRPGFEQFAQFTAEDAGAHEVSCVDSLDTYGGEYLVAGDTFGSGSIGLGRTGSNDFAVGTLLAFGAVVCPLFAVLVVIVIPLRRLRDRRRARR